MSAPADQPAAQVFLRPIANPLPLGFLALAAGTLMVSALQLGWLAPSDGHTVALILIAFVFPLQLLTSIFSYLARDVVAGTGMGILSGTWLTIGLVTLDSPTGATSDALGLFLLMAGVAMWVPASAALASKLVPAAVLGTAGLRFMVTGAYELSAASSWQHIAGIVGLFLCALGIYAALAMALEDARGATVLPLGRRASGDRAIGGDLAAQIAGVASEAGVRNQL
jgi:succinate-acetate transporter protein